MADSKDWFGYVITTSRVEFGRGNFKVTFTPDNVLGSQPPSGVPIDRMQAVVLLALDPEIDVAEYTAPSGNSQIDFIGKAKELATE